MSVCALLACETHKGGRMHGWEIKNLWVPLDLKKGELSTTEHAVNIGFEPTWEDEFNNGWAKAESLAAEGWELIAVAPETAGRMTVGEKNGIPVAGGTSYTAGHMLVFRRQKT